MINAHLSPMPNGNQVLASFRFFDGTELSQTVYNKKTAQADAERQLNSLIRNTMTEKLLGFLNQRKHALAHTGRASIAEALYNLIEAYKLTNYGCIARIVRQNMSAFDDVMPAVGSRFYNDFEKKVKPILDFCTGKDIQGE